MPTYEYRCPLGHEFERFQRMSDPARAKCPSCGRMATRQISGGAGLIFKGSGFYITDYGKDGKGPRKEEAAAETKPDAAAAKPDAASAKPEKSEGEPGAAKKPKAPKKKASS